MRLRQNIGVAARPGYRRRWLLSLTTVALLAITAEACGSNSNSAGTTTTTAGTTTTTEPACSQPCADANGIVAELSNVVYDAAPNNQYYKPNAGNVFVTVNVLFINKSSRTRNVYSSDFKLRSAGVEHSTSDLGGDFADALNPAITCPAWKSSVGSSVAPGRTYGPRCLAFEAVANQPTGLVVVWSPSSRSSYEIPLTEAPQKATHAQAEVATFNAALAAWRDYVANGRVTTPVTDVSGHEQPDALSVMRSITWRGAAAALAQTLITDLGQIHGLNRQPQSEKIAAGFMALGQALGVSVGPIGTLPPQPPGVVVTITGTGPASNITLLISGQLTQKTQVPLPYTYTQPTPASVSVSAQDGSGASGATITCTITALGQQKATNTSTGPYAVVTCQE